MMTFKATTTALALVLSFSLVGCTSSEEPISPESNTPSATETQTAEPTAAPEAVPSESDLRQALLSPADISADAVAGVPAADLESAFFGDLLENNACQNSSFSSFEGLNALELKTAQVINVGDEVLWAIVQWVYSADSTKAAEALVQDFSENFLTDACYATLGKDFNQKVDFTDSLPIGTTGFIWIDTNTLSGDVYTQIRGISSVGNLVYFSVSIATDSPLSPLLPNDLSRWTGAGMVQFIGAF